MDVTCATCREPWNTYHMRHEAIFDCVERGTLSDREARAWDGKLTPGITTCFKDAGWEFAGSVMAIVRCPACPKDRPTNEAGADARRTLAALTDEDGLASTLDEFPNL